MDKVRLDKIIAVKEKILEDKHREIQRMEQILEGFAVELNRVDETISWNYERMSPHPLEGSDFSVLKNYIAFLEIRKGELLQERERAEQERERIRLELLEMLKEVKVLEKLKERVLRAARKVLNREQQKQLDEIALRISDKQ